MIERILEILKYKNLTPAQFADMIGVQRSSISHLISGRNKPSLEFLQKILKTFPGINTDWLLFGKGEMVNSENNAVHMKNPVSDIIQNKEAQIEKILPAAKEEVEKVQKKKWIEPEAKKIEKIVYFYRDGTFREYFPVES